MRNPNQTAKPPQELLKFYKRKHFFFSKYDAGILIDDEEGWFSVTPEPIANFTAYFVEKFPNAIVVDGCCCVGGNLIQFALRENVNKVYGVELNKERISYAEHNCCVVYDVPKKKVEFINKSITEADIAGALKI